MTGPRGPTEGHANLVAADAPVLRQRAQEAELGEIPALIERLTQVLRACDALGVAAPQIGVSLRVAVLRDAPHLLVNPLIVERSADTEVQDEGCLSLPGVTVAVRRHYWVRVASGGVNHMMRGLTARVVQHEVDHLDGRLITDYAVQP